MIPVETENGQKLEAMIYVMDDFLCDYIIPSDIYKNTCEVGFDSSGIDKKQLNDAYSEVKGNLMDKFTKNSKSNKIARRLIYEADFYAKIEGGKRYKNYASQGISENECLIAQEQYYFQRKIARLKQAPRLGKKVDKILNLEIIKNEYLLNMKEKKTLGTMKELQHDKSKGWIPKMPQPESVLKIMHDNPGRGNENAVSIGKSLSAKLPGGVG